MRVRDDEPAEEVGEAGAEVDWKIGTFGFNVGLDLASLERSSREFLARRFGQ